MHPHLNILLNLLLDRYFQNFYCVFMIGDDLPHSFNVKSVVYSGPDFLDLELGCEGFVIQSENAASIFKQVEHKMLTNEIARFNRRRYLFVSYSSEIFGINQLEHVNDVLLVQPEPQRFKLLTHGFVGSKHKEPTLVDVWFPENQTFLYNTPLYPRITNYQGRTFTVSSFNYIPSDILGDSFETSTGIEMSLLAEFSKKMNFTVLLKDKGDEEWGHGFEDGTGYGVIGDVTLQRSDIGASQVFMMHRSNRVDVSMMVIDVRMFVMVPKAREVINLLTPFSQFSPHVWGLNILFILFINLVVFVCLLKIEGNRRRVRKLWLFMETTHRIVSLCLLQSIKTEDYFRHVKSLLLNLFLLILILSNAYSSGLSCRMTIPSYGEEINTLHDLAKSNLPWGSVDKSLWTSVIDYDEREVFKTIVSNFEEHNETELRTLRVSGKFGFPIEKLPSGYYAIQNYIDESALKNAQVMKEELYSAFSSLLVRKNFVLLPALDHFILRVQEYGLILKWERKALELCDPRLQSILENTRGKRKHKKLALIHIQGVLLIWVVGITLSILCFLCEVFKK